MSAEAEFEVDAAVNPRIPLVTYLELEPAPHLVAQQCVACGARFFDRRNACASCGGSAFDAVSVADQGEVRSFTIVSVAADGVEVPYVAAIVDCEGTSVRANLLEVPPDPEHVHLGMSVRLTTYSLGLDERGVEAIGFGFAPVSGIQSETLTRG